MLSKLAKLDRNIGECRNERKTDSDDVTADRSKFKKVEMPVFIGDDPDSWLFRAERLSRWNSLGKFLRIKQETTVEEYRNLFDKLVAPLFDVQEKVAEDTFMNGLFQWIRAEVAFCRPKGLAEMMQVAQLVENRDLIRNEASLNGFSGGKYPPQTVSSKFQARKEKGLCFHCDEKYSADHKCKMKELRELRMFVVVGENEYEIVEEKERAEKGLAMLEVKDDNQTFVELSIN
ncbi:transposon Tf2-1 polyprotein isoform X1 [Cucumis melo var. makuwa]|uniref:Transposon Tf2-1 polyprotein isoform X1 n=1 Tax=Cucumis melo var. makuwa TaxID=1194695 RepID=A0A5A7TGN8_CUCMM|nr:transposon Tf2-1 polyprotein isoform X1 [Cucumis melo var. makuwa]TYK17944.1 transposon Tf2-1 polyprotein isoform X1 [Cucumis melo var. makuwa]